MAIQRTLTNQTNRTMRKSIKIMIAAALMLISASAYAQLSVGAGYLNTTLLEKQGSLSSGENFNGLYIEADWKINIYSDFIGFTPGVRYNFGTTSVEGVSWNEQYVDIPLMFDFGYSFSDSFRFFAFTGPSISLGISSNMKSSGVKVNMYEFTGEYLDGVADYGRFDLMFGYGIGADICGRVRIKAALDHGLLNRMKNNLGSVTHRNLIRLGAAYLF